MDKPLTKYEANRLLRVTPERHDAIGHLAIDRGTSMIEVADRALEFGIRHLQAEARKPARVASPN